MLHRCEFLLTSRHCFRAQLGDTLVFENIRVRFSESTGFDNVEIEVLVE